MVREDRLSDLFRQTGGTGKDPLTGNNPGLEYLESGSEFLNNFNTPSTGANGSGPILNSNANLLPTRADQYRDISDRLDFKLGNGLGVARPYRKNDSIGGNTERGFYGYSEPSKMFGRNSTSYDLNYKREEMTERARASFKKMGFKPNEVPRDADFFPWQWNDLQALGIGGAPIHNGNQYNRNYAPPDADAVARRIYQPAPSKMTKMIQTDVETAALRPNRTMLHPLKVVTEDRQRMKLQRPSRNTDVIESVIYEKGVQPRGMGTNHNPPKVWADSDVLRQPVGNNGTGDRSLDGRWNNAYANVNPLLDATLEDRLVMFKNTTEQVRGFDLEKETKQFREGELKLLRQIVKDPNQIQPREGEFPNNRQGLNVPLEMQPGIGNDFYLETLERPT